MATIFILLLASIPVLFAGLMIGGAIGALLDNLFGWADADLFFAGAGLGLSYGAVSAWFPW